jgi:hypothetical protein
MMSCNYSALSISMANFLANYQHDFFGFVALARLTAGAAPIESIA